MRVLSVCSTVRTVGTVGRNIKALIVPLTKLSFQLY